MATILIVEDIAATRRPMMRLLKAEGYAVITAVDAYAAASRLRNERPDLVLLDVGIPPMDGLTMLMLLRNEIGASEIPPVILVTGFDDDNTMARAKALGVKECLIKSHFEPEDLLAAIKRHLVPAKVGFGGVAAEPGMA